MKVLIATDGSDFSKAAIEKACEMLAKGENDLVEVISVSAEVSNPGTEPFAVSTEYIQEMEKIGREQATKFVSEAEEIIRGRFANSSVQITTKIIKGSAGRAIVEEAESWGADLIVVGSHGYGFWGRTFLGSTSNQVIHHAHCSVLVVRKKSDGPSAKD